MCNKKNAENKMLTLFEKSITKIQKFQLFKIDDKTDQKRRIIGDIFELKAYFDGSKQLYAAQFKQNNGLDVPFFFILSRETIISDKFPNNTKFTFHKIRIA